MARGPNLIERLGMALAGDYLREADGLTIDPDDDMYRRATGSSRDIDPIKHDRAQELSLYLWRQNPMARRIVELVVDFVVGDGLTVEAADDAVQQVVDDIWQDPRMNLELRHRDFVRDLSIYGELALRKYVNADSGRTRLGYIDVNRIKDVRLDPQDVLTDQDLVLYGPGGLNDEVVPIVSWTDQGAWTGDAFYFAINRVTGQHRGTPDLLSLADWVDAYDQLLFNALEKSGLQNAFVWDVTLANADTSRVQEWQTQHAAPPRPGSIRVHNDMEQWQAVSPVFHTADVTDIGRAIKNMALGGAGLPEAWYAEGDSANRATLAAQGDPTYRMLASRQRYVKAMFDRILTVLASERLGRGLPSDSDLEISVNMPDPSTKDTSAISAAVAQITASLAEAVDNEWISNKSARQVYLGMVGQLGTDLDPTAEEEAIAAEEEDRTADQDAEAERMVNLMRAQQQQQPEQQQAPGMPPEAPEEE